MLHPPGREQLRKGRDVRVRLRPDDGDRARIVQFLPWLLSSTRMLVRFAARSKRLQTGAHDCCGLTNDEREARPRRDAGRDRAHG